MSSRATFSFSATCPACGGALEVDDVTEPTSRRRDAATTCTGCDREWVITVTLRPAGSVLAAEDAA